MFASNLLVELFEYKSWSEGKIFDCLLTADIHNHPAELKEGLYYLAHINIVDKIFISRLTGTSTEFTSTVTDEEQDIGELEQDFRNTNKWLLDYVKNITAHELQERISFTFMDGDDGNMTREQILTHLITHGLLHKSQVAGIFPKDFLKGWKSNFTSYLNR
ncbi:DinB family protein [Pseudomonas taiwanensis]|uniref:DinB family protein n=1 Tax=Pseudomonas taiwanensis TaxID=470150 RepID=UPI000482F270|nr:DinB family protein [Pseudomonas taiwanensis]